MTQDREITPQLFADLFEDDRRGAAVLEHLIRRFVRPAVTSGGIDAVLQTFHNQGARAPLDFIVLQINRAHEVDVGDDDEPSPFTGDLP